MEKEKPWFTDWFDSVYYHELYNHRDDKEAEQFIKNLVYFFQMENGSKVFDLGCGAGRHVRSLSTLGMEAKGMDLAENSIIEARKLGGQAFYVGDMRDEFPVKGMDFVFNLFTSFGYFDSERENEKVLAHVYNSIKPGGTLVIDFLNAEKVSENLVEEEVIHRGDRNYEIRRWISQDIIHKNIQFVDVDQKKWEITEKVQALSQATFRTLLEKTGFTVDSEFGNYNLAPFNSNSDRYIVVAKRS